MLGPDADNINRSSNTSNAGGREGSLPAGGEGETRTANRCNHGDNMIELRKKQVRTKVALTPGPGIQNQGDEPGGRVGRLFHSDG